MSKRFVNHCADLINDSGPLSPDDLAPSVLAAGLTKSGNPAAAVRTTLRQSPVMVQLADGRFDSVRRILDGSALTHRVRYATAGRQVLFAGPELAMLDQVLVHEGSLALSAGGAVTSSSGTFGGWCGPPGWLPDVPADSLLAFRLRNGRLSVETVADEPSPSSPGVEHLRVVLRRQLTSTDGLGQWHSQRTLGTLLIRALIEIPDLLAAELLPPLDEVLQLGTERWGRGWSVEPGEEVRTGAPVVLDDLPLPLIAALRRDAEKLGVSLGELTVLLLSAATYRLALPCRHDAEVAWLSHPPTGRDPAGDPRSVAGLVEPSYQ
jgi:hypothetical protein